MIRIITGRPFRVAVISLGLAALALGSTWVTGNRFDGLWDAVMGGWALAVALILLGSWWLRDDKGVRAGLFLSVILWGFTALINTVSLGTATSSLIALCWLFLAGGTYWLESSATSAASKE